MSDVAIKADRVSKKFKLFHDRPQTLKERVVRFRRRSFEEFWALKDVSLEVGRGETLGLIGANGSGKTTLLKLIAGIFESDEGRVTIYGRIASLLELGAGFHPELTGRENVFLNASILGLTRRETERYFDDIVAFSELENFIDLQVKHYSSGMYVRLGFSVAVHVDPEILLVDEVLAVGDEVFQRKCLDRISDFQEQGRTIIFVSHGVDLVRQVCDRAAFLHHGQLRSVGPTGDVVRLFRETLHGEAHLEAAPGQERGSREIQILSVSLRDQEGKERTSFKSGEELEIVVDLDFTRRVDDAVVGMMIYDQRDQPVFGTNTGLRNIDLSDIQGKARARFLLHELPLQDEKYRLTVAVHSQDNRTVYHWQERFYSFWSYKVGVDAGGTRIASDLNIEQL